MLQHTLSVTTNSSIININNFFPLSVKCSKHF